MFIVPCNGQFEIRERMFDVSPNTGKMIRLERTVETVRSFAIAKAKLIQYNQMNKERATA